MNGSVRDYPISEINEQVPVRRPTVYVVQVHRQRRGEDMVEKYDLTPARAFGSLNYLLDGTQRMDVPEVVELLYTGLDEMRQDDYLLLVGNPVFIGLATAIAADITDGIFNVLQWRREENCYRTVAINMEYGTEGT